MVRKGQARIAGLRWNETYGTRPMSEMAHVATDVSAPRYQPLGSRGARVAELDALRGIGALLILAYHLWPSTFFFGWTRVDFFFVLSGFLITSSICNKSLNIRHIIMFWFRRALRTWPPYYMVIVFSCLVILCHGDSPRRGSLIAYLTFTQHIVAYWGTDGPPILSGAHQTWSLAIEEQFYFLWPIIVFLGGRRWLVPTATCMIVESVAARFLGLRPLVALARCDGLALGAILAAIHANPVRRQSGVKRLSIGFLLLGTGAVVLLNNPMNWLDRIEAYDLRVAGCGPLAIFLVNLLYFAVIGLVVCQRGHPLLAPLRVRALGHLGRISYGIFLYHILIFQTVTQRVSAPTLTRDLGIVVLTLIAAAVSWMCLERPLGNLKNRFTC